MMGKLSKEQQEQLAELERLRDAPDDEPRGGGRSEALNFTIDLSDEQAVERAIGLGLLTPADVNDDGGDDGDGDGDEPDPAPRRRVTGADRWADK